MWFGCARYVTVGIIGRFLPATREGQLLVARLRDGGGGIRGLVFNGFVQPAALIDGDPATGAYHLNTERRDMMKDIGLNADDQVMKSLLDCLMQPEQLEAASMLAKSRYPRACTEVGIMVALAVLSKAKLEHAIPAIVGVLTDALARANDIPISQESVNADVAPSS
jgi:hypothetical protein